MKYYIKLNGLYTAAVENEKSTLEFLQEHFAKERIHPKEAEKALGELAAWFRRSGERIANHTVKLTGKPDLIVTRIPKADYRKRSAD